MSDEDQESTLPGIEPESEPELNNRYKDPSGNIDPALWRTGVDDLNKMNIAGGFVWNNVGPSPLNNLTDAAYYQGRQPVGGEVTDIAIDPSGATDSIIYVATNNGGIWKTTDGGNSWFPTSDSLPSLSMGAVALDPVNPSIVYAGSGNLFDGSGGFIKAAGLFKSVDGGKTWFVADGGVFGSTFQGVGINRIICPAADSLLVGTKSGLFRSIDGGFNFGANAPAFNDGNPILPGFVTTLTMDSDPAQPNVAWAAIRGLDDRGNSFSGGGLFRLTLNADGSVTPSANLLNPGELVGVQFGSIVFAQAGPPNRQTLYVSVQGQDANKRPVFLNLYLSNDEGATWQPPLGGLKAALQGVAGQTDREDDQSSYDFTLGCDPQNLNILCAGFKRIWSSQNGGVSFVQSSQAYGAALVHWDQHELVFSPKSHWGPAGLPTDVWVGSDGGVARHRVVAITNATNASPIVVTAANHGFLTGNRAIITGVNGNAAANSPANAPWPITVIDANTFSLDGSTGNGAYTNGGTADVWTQLNAGANTHLFFGIDIGRGNAANQQFTYGGMQDNGTPGHRSADAGTTWLAGIDGDGGVTAVDPTNPGIIFGFDDTDTIRSANQGVDWVTSDQDSVSITNATNASPIVVTANGHLFQTGDKVTIANVQGITAANSPANVPWVVTVIDPNNFSLNGSTGNGAYTSGGFAQGRRFGRNLQNPRTFVRYVALVPNGANPATTVYIAEETSLRKSSDGGANFDPKPVRTFDAYVFSVICPDANRLWVGTGDGQVHFSPDGGSSWQDFSPGGTGPVTSIAADPGTLDTVAVVYAGFSRINSRVRTKHCFLSTDSGANWADISGTDDSITGNLPDLPLHSVVFDDSTAPPTIIVGADMSVLRSQNNGVSWERLGTALPRVTCRSLALDQLDTTRSPRLLRIGTYGRSCFELTRASGPALAAEANLAFGAVVQGQSATLPLQLLNVGDAPVNITSFARSAGDADFDFASAPNLLALNPGEVRPFGVKFTAGGNDKDIRTATFTLESPDVPSVQIFASGVTYAAAGKSPRISVNASLSFGQIPRGAHRLLSFTIASTGLSDLQITVFSLTGSSDFSISIPVLPLVLHAGAQQSFDMTFSPGTWGGSSQGKLLLSSNDPRQPSVLVSATGSAPFNSALLIGLIVLGAAVIAGGVAAYELAKKH
jgi:hypothetical protein